MVRRLVAIITAASVLHGCAAVQRPFDPIASESGLEDLNRVLRGRSVMIELFHSVEYQRGRGFRAENVRVGEDSTSFTLLRGAKRDSTLSTSAIDRITITRRLRGAFSGALVGFGAGFAAGAVLGAASYEPSGDDWGVGPGSSGGAAVWGGVFMGIIGSGVGLIIGAVAGHEEVYDFVYRRPHDSSEFPQDRGSDGAERARSLPN